MKILLLALLYMKQKRISSLGRLSLFVEDGLPLLSRQHRHLLRCTHVMLLRWRLRKLLLFLKGVLLQHLLLLLLVLVPPGKVTCLELLLLMSLQHCFAFKSCL